MTESEIIVLLVLALEKIRAETAGGMLLNVDPALIDDIAKEAIESVNGQY